MPDSILPPLPLRAPNGRVFAYACPRCFAVAFYSHDDPCEPGDTDEQGVCNVEVLARRSRRIAARCCQCRTCGVVVLRGTQCLACGDRALSDLMKRIEADYARRGETMPEHLKRP